MAPGAFDLAFQGGQRGQRIRGVAGQSCPFCVLAQLLRAVLGKVELAYRGDMQRRAGADQVHHPDRGTTAGSAFDIDDLVALAHAEIDALPELLVQALHQRHGGLADADARLDHVAQFQQADAEPVGAGFGALDEAGTGHRRQDAVRGRRVQSGFQCQLLEADRIGVVGKDIEQLHHALDDLDAATGFGGGIRAGCRHGNLFAGTGLRIL